MNSTTSDVISSLFAELSVDAELEPCSMLNAMRPRIQLAMKAPEQAWKNQGTDLRVTEPYAGSRGSLPRQMSSAIALGRAKLRIGTNHAPIVHPRLKRRPWMPRRPTLVYASRNQAMNGTAA